MVSLVLRIAVDVVCILIVAIPLIIYKVGGKPFERGFFCDDESIRHPYKDGTISSFVLYFVGTNSNFLTMIILELYHSRLTMLPSRNIGRIKLPGVCYELYRVIGVFGFGCCLSQLTTDIAKYMVGRLRPHFLNICNPDPTELLKLCQNSSMPGYDVYVENYHCRGDPGKIREARLSFPSGHSSFSAFTMVYLALYLQARMPNKPFKLLRPLLQFGVLMMAMSCALSRISDYKHHWSDVLAGLIQGTIVALIVVFFISDLYKTRSHEGNDSTLPLRSQQSAVRIYSDNSHQLSGVEHKEPTP